MKREELDKLIESVPIEGSIDLLALGHIGLYLWRIKKEQNLIKGKENNTENVKNVDEKEK